MKQPYIVHLDGFRPFAFAGIWTARNVSGEWHRSFAILTKAATAELAHIHERMPVPLNPSDYDAWLTPETPVEHVQQLLAHTFDRVAMYPVSTYVNKPEHDDAQCIQPVELTDSGPDSRDATSRRP